MILKRSESLMGEILIPATNGPDDLVQIGALGVNGVVMNTENRMDFIQEFWSACGGVRWGEFGRLTFRLDRSKRRVAVGRADSALNMF